MTLFTFLTLAMGLYVIDMVFPGSIVETLLIESIPTQKLIKSGSPVLCDMGLEKIATLSSEEKTELKAFLVREFSEGPEQVRRAERMSLLDGVSYMVPNEQPAEYCLFKVVMKFADETPELLPLLARSDNLKGYPRHLVIEALEIYIRKSPTSISHFTIYLKDFQSTESSFATALFELAGESGNQIVMKELLSYLENPQKKLDSRQIQFYWNLIEKFLVKNAGDNPCPPEIAKIILHPHLSKELNSSMALNLVSIFGREELPTDVLKLADSKIEKSPGTLSNGIPFLYLVDRKVRLLEKLEKRSGNWKSTTDFTQTDRDIFLDYFKKVKNDLVNRNKHGAEFRKLSKNKYPLEKAPFSVSTELKIVLENPQFPQDLKLQFSTYLRKNSKLQHANYIDQFIADQYVRLNKMKTETELNQQNYNREFFKKHLYVSLDMYFFVFKKLFESPNLEKSHSGQNKYPMAAPQDNTAFATYFHYMKSPYKEKIVQAYFSNQRTQSLDMVTLAFKSLGEENEEFSQHVNLNFKCDHNSYVSLVYFFSNEKSQSLVEKLLDCPVDFLAKRQKWHELIDAEILAKAFEKEKEEKKKAFLLGLYEEFQQVKF